MFHQAGSPYWLRSYFAYLNSEIAKNNHSSGSINLVTVLTVVASIAGIYAAIIATQQMTSTIRRRKRQKTQDKLLDTIQLTEDEETAKANVERLREQIDHQIPIQARRDYLTERLEKLAHDINRDYGDYQDAEKELAETSPKSALDKQIRRVIETAIVPKRKVQEKRSAATLIIVLALLLTSISPYNLNSLVYSYFNILGYSDQSLPETIIWAMLLGVIVLTIVLILAQLLVYQSSRMQRFFQWISRRHIILLAFLIFLALILAGGFAREVAVGDQNSTIYNIAIPETIAGFSFNIAVIAASISAAGLWLRRQAAATARRQRRESSDVSGHADSQDPATSPQVVVPADSQADSQRTVHGEQHEAGHQA